MSGLTTHVLDTAHGHPAKGVAIRLYRDGLLLADCVTNSDGRCDKPLLTGAEMDIGRYHLEFSVGDYFRAQGTPMPTPSFLDVVTIDFGVADPLAHFHVPLLVSPYGYSTYRGS